MIDFNILLVEDDEVDIMNIKRALKKAGVTNPLFIANNGIEALELLRREENRVSDPKLILLDINMPKMNGIEFLKELRADEQIKNIPVFVLTTSDEDSDKFDAYNLNVAGYILKPLSFDDFMSKVQALISYWAINESYS